MATYTDSYTVASLTELKALTTTQRRSGMAVYVLSPEVGYPSAVYGFVSSSTLTELLPVIATPNDTPTTGRWISSNPVYITTAAPTAAPDLIGVVWVANISTSPARTTIYRSIGTSGVSDWVATTTTSVTDVSAPVFNADFVGQKVLDSGSGENYMALDLSGNYGQIGI